MASIVVTGDTSGAITIAAPAVAGTNTLTLPASTGTLVVTGGAQTIEFADGSAAAPSITNSGDTNTGMFFPAADTIAFTEGGVESMRIDSSGNVGIGTTSVTSGVRVDVVSADASQQFVDVLRLKTTSTGDRHPSILFENNRSSVANALKLCMDSTDSAGTGEFTLRIKDSGGTFNTRLNISNNGNLLFNSGYGSVAVAYGCRAWVNFNGTGTPAIRASGNVSSITDNGDGRYAINFTTAMPDANYGANVSVCGMPGVSDANFITTDQNNTVRVNPTTSSFAMTVFRYQGTPLDADFVRVSVFR